MIKRYIKGKVEFSIGDAITYLDKNRKESYAIIASFGTDHISGKGFFSFIDLGEDGCVKCDRVNALFEKDRSKSPRKYKFELYKRMHELNPLSDKNDAEIVNRLGEVSRQVLEYEGLRVNDVIRYFKSDYDPKSEKLQDSISSPSFCYGITRFPTRVSDGKTVIEYVDLKSPFNIHYLTVEEMRTPVDKTRYPDSQQELMFEKLEGRSMYCYTSTLSPLDAVHYAML